MLSRSPSSYTGRLLATLLAMCVVTTAFADEQEDFFEKQVRPLLNAKCLKCHSKDSAKAGGGLLLDSREGWQTGGDSGTAIIPGDLQSSLLLQAVRYADDVSGMPPEEAGGKLTAAEIAVLEQWVQTGANDPRSNATQLGGMQLSEAKDWWSFQPLATPGDRLSAARIDELLQQRRQEHGLSSSAVADRATLIRRACFDLTGLPPQPEQMQRYLAAADGTWLSELTEELLKSQNYGVHWGRHWLDVVRYADTAGENTDRPLPHAWRYRNWVMQSLQDDLPFDQFVRMQLAGDLLHAEDSEQQRRDGIIATGYLAVARRFGHDIDKDIHLTFEDVIDNMGRSFLGLSLGCARCHDHKYDPVSSDDYYALYGVFQSTRFSFPGCEPQGQPRDLVPLPADEVVSKLTAEYERLKASFDAAEAVLQKDRSQLEQFVDSQAQLLAESAVGEGQQVLLADAAPPLNQPVQVRRGEIILLTVLPNANHGADTTRVDLRFTATIGEEQRVWSTDDLLDDFVAGSSLLTRNDAGWCVLDLRAEPTPLPDRKQQISGVAGLEGWATGELPSSIVNSNANPVDVWTKLPPRAFFVHPGPGQNVGVAWISPIDGEVRISGSVTDAHPAGLDGVSFRLQHLTTPDAGPSLTRLQQGLLNRGAAPTTPQIPVAYAVTEGTVTDAVKQLRGDPEQPGDAIARHWLTCFGGDALGSAEISGRGELADRIVTHPLFARVLANRVWQWHFGAGLVRTPNDFGARGDAPTHPELLELLAAELVANGFQLKPLHRLIMQTQAWQLSSAGTLAARRDDPGNQWLTHFSRRRLAAEEIRDSLLQSAGMLDGSWGEAHPFPPESTWGFTQHNPFNAVYETNLRSAFLMVQRQRRHPYLALFDGADPNSSTAVREASVVPAQALYFLNSEFFHRQAQQTAARTAAVPVADDRLRELSQLILQRDPTADERQVADQFLRNFAGTDAEKWDAWARILMASNEFLFLD